VSALVAPTDCPPACRRLGCAISIDTVPAADGSFTLHHLTAEGHDHLIAVPRTLFDDASADIWGSITARIDDVHGSMGMP
jgi:hypothetical protein